MKTKLFIIITVVLAFGSGQAPAVPYIITDLGALGSDWESMAFGINDSGQVVGYSAPFQQDLGTAFLWENGTMTSLGTLGGDHSGAYAINNAGQVVGRSRTATGSYDSQAFLWENGSMTNLGTLGGDRSVAYDINNNGIVVGLSDVSGTDYHAFIWQNDSMDSLGTLGGDLSRAYAVNDSEQVVGTADDSQNEQYSFIWENETMLPLLGNDSFAFDINETGQIAGDYKTPGYPSYRHAYLWENGSLTDLGTLSGSNSSSATAINNSGQIVGISDYTAFIWENGTITDLNELLLNGSEWELEEARDINNLGQIVGRGIINERERAFLLTPIPEPFSLLILGLGGIIVMRKKTN